MTNKKSETETVKKKKSNVYWRGYLDQIIDQYNQETDQLNKEHLYNTYLYYPLDKLAENIINRFKFTYIHDGFEEIKHDVVGFLTLNLDKYNSSKAKSFSYFSVIAKNYLIALNSHGYKQEKTLTHLIKDDDQSDIANASRHEEQAQLSVDRPEDQEDLQEFLDLIIKYWEENATIIFPKKRDSDIALAVVELLRRATVLETTSKKALYLMIREMTNSKTGYITKVLRKMQNHILQQLSLYQSTGAITDDHLDLD